jgi:hypothetical protein
MRENVTKEERLRAVQRGVDNALRESALLGHSVCIWRGGKVIWLSPAEVLAKLGPSDDARPAPEAPTEP